MAPPNPAYSFLNTIRYGFDDAAQTDAMLCLDHAHELLKPQVISTWMPAGVGSKPGKRTIFAETQVCLSSFYFITVSKWVIIQLHAYHSTLNIYSGNSKIALIYALTVTNLKFTGNAI